MSFKKIRIDRPGGVWDPFYHTKDSLGCLPYLERHKQVVFSFEACKIFVKE